jgi:transposase
MLTIGVDSHKRTLTAVAVDSTGRQVAAIQVLSSPRGRAQLIDWAGELGNAESTRWGIEGTGSYGRSLAQQLSRAGGRVVEVPGIATARERRAAIGVHRQKTDSSDALAIARVAVRDQGRLPVIFPHGTAHHCKLLSEHRDNLVLQRTRLLNQLHAQVSFLDEGPVPSMSGRRGRVLLREWACEAAPSGDSLGHIHRQVIQQLSKLILTYDDLICRLGRQLTRAATEAAPALVRLCGVGALTAARILGEVGDVRRFASPAKFASYCGVAPIQASSGDRLRHRLSRRGNRRLNFSIHTIAVTQRRWDPRAKAFLERKITEGKSRKEAIRCLKRHLSNVVFRLLTESAAEQREAVAV